MNRRDEVGTQTVGLQNLQEEKSSYAEFSKIRFYSGTTPGEAARETMDSKGFRWSQAVPPWGLWGLSDCANRKPEQYPLPGCIALDILQLVTGQLVV
jgi:hypothetical protein